MKDFLQRNINLVAGVTGLCFVVIFVLMSLLIGARELQRETLARYDKPAEDRIPLIGRENSIGSRSKKQIDILLGETPGVLGAWVLPVEYKNNEYPIVHVYAKDPVIREGAEYFRALQSSPDGRASTSFSGKEAALRNSEEARSGLIKCVSIGLSATQVTAPVIATKAKTVCRSTIPPFDEDSNMAVVVFSDVEDLDSDEMQAIRRVMLQLQIDIFNRDWQGRETWVRAS